MQQDSTEPTGVRDDSPRGGSEVIRARERKAHAAIEMRKAGASWDDIATVLGFPTGRSALVATEQTLEKELKTDESQAFMRRMVSQRLDRLLRGIWKKAIDEESPDQFAAIDRARLLMTDFRKLHGLDAPSEYLVSTPSQAELERWVSTVLAAQTPAVTEGDIFDVDWEEGDDGAAQAQ